jgi:hypothetical protein
MNPGSEAFLAIWHDIDPAMAAEWHRWHTEEHMPERVGIPGFLAGRRYMNPAVPRHACFTLYEGRDLSVFGSPAYLERLNAPTPWTRSMAPAFRNFMRGACRRVASAGQEQGYGGALLTIRLEGTADPAPDQVGQGLVDNIADCEGIVGAHLGVCVPEVTKADSNERALRSATEEEIFDGVLLVEAYDAALLERSAATVEARCFRRCLATMKAWPR